MERGHNRDDKGGYHGEGSSSSCAPYGPNPYYHHLPQPVAVENKWTSWLVPLIVLANIAMFVLTMYVNDCPSHRNRVLGNCVAEDVLHRFSFQPLSQNPLFGPSSRALKKLGALEWDRVVNQHQGWRLITCIWLHAGVVHIFANMLSLLFIGLNFEKQFGFVRVGIIYLLSGFGGSVFSSLFLRNNVSVGASGALFGLLGSMLSELITNWTLYSNRASALFSIVFIIIINLVIGMLPYVDNFAHIGGFITGFLSGFVFLLRPQYSWRASQNLPDGSRLKSKYKAYQLILLIVALILLVIWFLVTVIMLFKKENGNDHCSWCHYVTCIPTSRWQC